MTVYCWKTEVCKDCMSFVNVGRLGHNVVAIFLGVHILTLQQPYFTTSPQRNCDVVATLLPHHIVSWDVSMGQSKGVVVIVLSRNGLLRTSVPLAY